MSVDHSSALSPVETAPVPGGDAPLDLGYVVAIENFSGPLDLLLFLVRRTELDIIDIPIVMIVDQFVETVSQWADLDLDVAGDFILMAASLLEIKARAIAPPVDGEAVSGADDDVIDPRSNLISSLLRYRRFKEATRLLEGLEAARSPCLARQLVEIIPEEVVDEGALDLSSVDVHLLLSTCDGIISRLNGLGPRTVMVDDVPMGIRIEHLIDALRDHLTRNFNDLIGPKPTRHTEVVTMLAVLESTRQRLVEVRQEYQYCDITVRLRDAAEIVEPAELIREEMPEPKRRTRMPLVTYHAPPGSEDGSDLVVDDEPDETDEQRFLRELEEASNVDALLARAVDLDAGFLAFCHAHRPDVARILAPPVIRSPELDLASATTIHVDNSRGADATSPAALESQVESPPDVPSALPDFPIAQAIRDTDLVPPIATDGASHPETIESPAPRDDLQSTASSETSPSLENIDLRHAHVIPPAADSTAIVADTDHLILSTVQPPETWLPGDSSTGSIGEQQGVRDDHEVDSRGVPLPATNTLDPTSSDETATDAAAPDVVPLTAIASTTETSDAITTAFAQAPPVDVTIVHSQLTPTDASATTEAPAVPAVVQSNNVEQTIQSISWPEPATALTPYASSDAVVDSTSTSSDESMSRVTPLPSSIGDISGENLSSGMSPGIEHAAPVPGNGSLAAAHPVGLQQPVVATEAAPCAISGPLGTDEPFSATTTSGDRLANDVQTPDHVDASPELIRPERTASPLQEEHAQAHEAAAPVPQRALPESTRPEAIASVLSAPDPALKSQSNATTPILVTICLPDSGPAPAVLGRGPERDPGDPESAPTIVDDTLAPLISAEPMASPDVASVVAPPVEVGHPSDHATIEPNPTPPPPPDPDPKPRAGSPPRPLPPPNHPITTRPTPNRTHPTMKPSHQPKALIIAAFAALNLAWLAYVFLSWVPKNVLELIAAPAPLLEGHPPLRFAFNLDLVGDMALTQTPSSVPTISPLVSGTWSWQDRRTLQFTPTQDLPVATAFHVHLAKEALRSATGFRLGRDLDQDFHTPALSAREARVETYSAQGTAIVVIDFNHVVDPQAIAQHLTVIYADQTSQAPAPSVTVTPLNTAPSERVRLSIATGNQFDLKPALLTLPSGTTGLAGTLGLEHAWQTTAELGHALAVRSATAEAPPRGDITVHLATSAGITALSLLSESVSVEPSIPYSVHTTATGIDLVGAFEPEHTYRVTIAERWPESAPLRPLASYPCAGNLTVTIPERRHGLWLDDVALRDGQLRIGGHAIDKATLEVLSAHDDQALVSSDIPLDDMNDDAVMSASIDGDALFATLPSGLYRLRIHASDDPMLVVETSLQVQDQPVRPHALATSLVTWVAAGIMDQGGNDVTVRTHHIVQ